MVWNATSTALDYIKIDDGKIDDGDKKIKWYNKITIDSIKEFFKKCYSRKDSFI